MDMTLFKFKPSNYSKVKTELKNADFEHLFKMKYANSLA